MLKKLTLLLAVLGLAFILMLLTTGESRFEVRSHAGYVASPVKVWAMLADVERWPGWWPGLEDARLAGGLIPGSEIFLRLNGMPTKGPALLMAVRSQHELVWEGPGVLGSRAGTRLLLEAEVAGSRLTVENYVRGPQAFLARFTGEEAFVRYQQTLLERFGLALQGKLPVAGEKD